MHPGSPARGCLTPSASRLSNRRARFLGREGGDRVGADHSPRHPPIRNELLAITVSNNSISPMAGGLPGAEGADLRLVRSHHDAGRGDLRAAVEPVPAHRAWPAGRTPARDHLVALAPSAVHRVRLEGRTPAPALNRRAPAHARHPSRAAPSKAASGGRIRSRRPAPALAADHVLAGRSDDDGLRVAHPRDACGRAARWAHAGRGVPVVPLVPAPRRARARAVVPVPRHVAPALRHLRVRDGHVRHGLRAPCAGVRPRVVSGCRLPRRPWC